MMHPSLFDSDERGEWLPCKLINGSEPIPHFEPPRYRTDGHGLSLTGHCTDGEPGKPQIQVPPFAIQHLRGRICEDIYPPGPKIDFDTGEITLPALFMV